MLIQAQILKCLAHRNSVFFVQVGSNDGLQGDPLHDLIISHAHWKGMFIEPVPHLFQRLKGNYDNAGRFIFENVAISDNNAPRKFYYVSEKAKAALGDSLPFWYDQTSSFNKDHLIKHIDRINKALRPYVVEDYIRTISLPALFARHDIERIDLLHIDVEGYDYQVLLQFDFLKYRPSVVLYEQEHLSDHEKQSARLLLEQHGYSCAAYGGDILAISKAEQAAARGRRTYRM
jgi:FkbM family methyltransferase